MAARESAAALGIQETAEGEQLTKDQTLILSFSQNEKELTVRGGRRITDHLKKIDKPCKFAVYTKQYN